MEAATYSLPPLPYAYDALEPAISKQIMELHHSKHHQTYITNLNAALKSQVQALKDNDIPTQIANQQAVTFNGGGHINHSLFWQNLTSPSSAEAKPSAAPKLSAAINEQWGSIDNFKQVFNKKLLGIQGSGWGWLVKDNETNRVAIVTTKDQDPVPATTTPIFGVDLWEHAFYLLYLNNKAAYVDNIWTVINWKTAEERYSGGREDAFKILKASI
ncbi:Manganese/iron superoxide dismutase [Delphinella strobiligena]|nr:Manganese/iron superoxide dismutase [Delphinella strobiligena]